MVGTALFLLLMVIFLGEYLGERARRRPVVSVFDQDPPASHHGSRWIRGS